MKLGLLDEKNKVTTRNFAQTHIWTLLQALDSRCGALSHNSVSTRLIKGSTVYHNAESACVRGMFDHVLTSRFIMHTTRKIPSLV